MKRHRFHKKKKARRNKWRRNDAGGATAAVRRYRPRLPPRAAPPDWKSMAAVIGA